MSVSFLTASAFGCCVAGTAALCFGFIGCCKLRSLGLLIVFGLALLNVGLGLLLTARTVRRVSAQRITIDISAALHNEGSWFFHDTYVLYTPMDEFAASRAAYVEAVKRPGTYCARVGVPLWATARPIVYDLTSGHCPHAGPRQ